MVAKPDTVSSNCSKTDLLVFQCELMQNCFIFNIRKLIGQHSQFYVPEVIDELTSKQVLTAELIEGTPLDKIGDVSQDVINEV